MGKLQIDNGLEGDAVKTEKLITALNQLNEVTVKVLFPIGHNDVQYSGGEIITLSRDSAEFHVASGNCEYIKQ